MSTNGRNHGFHVGVRSRSQKDHPTASANATSSTARDVHCSHDFQNVATPTPTTAPMSGASATL